LPSEGPALTARCSLPIPIAWEPCRVPLKPTPGHADYEGHTQPTCAFVADQASSVHVGG
jgi:hypothetical protein